MNGPVFCFCALAILLLCFLEHIYLIFVAPESVCFGMLLFDELIVGNIGSQEGIFIGSVGAFCNMTETGSKLVFSIFARNKSTVSRDLGSWVC
jgi:hypothetical protein